jgi:hypothetical protein
LEVVEVLLFVVGMYSTNCMYVRTVCYIHKYLFDYQYLVQEAAGNIDISEKIEFVVEIEH